MTEHVERARLPDVSRRSPGGPAPLQPAPNSDPARAVPYILNLSFPGIEAEVAIDAWSNLIAISNGAACTSQSYTCSHVLNAMGVPKPRMDEALRFSWCASTPQPDWSAMVNAAAPYMAGLRTP
jgi:cysteine desulfurase